MKENKDSHTIFSFENWYKIRIRGKCRHKVYRLSNTARQLEVNELGGKAVRVNEVSTSVEYNLSRLLNPKTAGRVAQEFISNNTFVIIQEGKTCMALLDNLPKRNITTGHDHTVLVI